jgi:hypothetical protein
LILGSFCTQLAFVRIAAVCHHRCGAPSLFDACVLPCYHYYLCCCRPGLIRSAIFQGLPDRFFHGGVRCFARLLLRPRLLEALLYHFRVS